MSLSSVIWKTLEHMTSSGEIDFLEVFRNFIDFFGCFCQNKQRKERNISGLNYLLTFVVGLGFKDLRIEFGSYFVSE